MRATGNPAFTVPGDLLDALRSALGKARASAEQPLNLIATSFNEAMRGQTAAILVPAGAEALRFAAATSDRLLAPDVPTIPLGSSIAGLAFLSGQTIALDDAQAAPNFFAAVDESSGLNTKEYLAAPIFHRSQRLGVLTVVNRAEGSEPTPFSAVELVIAERYAELAAVLMRHRDAFERHTASALASLEPDTVYSPFTGARLSQGDDPIELRAQILEALENVDASDLLLVRELAERLAGTSTG